MASDGPALRSIDKLNAILEARDARIAALEAELAEARAELDNSRANSVSRGKKLLRLRAKLIQISDNIEHEGDRAYFGSTNDADELREIFLWLDGFKWDRVMSESDEDDLISAVERLLARATAAEARAEKLAEALEPFARNVDSFQRLASDDICLDGTPYEKKSRLTLGDLRRARAALGGDHG